MRSFVRLPTPAILVEAISRNDSTLRWIHYGNKYRKNRTKKKGYEFSWPKIKGKPLNQHLLPDLRKQTVTHCSYCDAFPLGKGYESIDHFLPKQNATYYDLVCKWENLYLACGHCQASKRTNVNPLVLRPDEVGYSFTRYFIYNYIDHTIEINPKASPADQRQADITHRFFDFDNTELIIKRRHAYERYTKNSSLALDDYDFRFMFDS